MFKNNEGLYIDGSWIPAHNQATFDSENPATGKVVGLVPEATPQQIEDAVQAAHKARITWAKTPGPERAQYLQRASKEFEKSKDEIINLLIAETGSTFGKVCQRVEIARSQMNPTNTRIRQCLNFNSLFNS